MESQQQLVSDQAVLEAAIKQYDEFCKAQKNRAERFGVPYTEPDVSKVGLPLHVAKRLGKHLRQQKAADDAAAKAARQQRFKQDGNPAASSAASASSGSGDAVVPGDAAIVSGEGPAPPDSSTSPSTPPSNADQPAADAEQAGEDAAASGAAASSAAVGDAGADADGDVDLSGGIVPSAKLDSVQGGAGAAALGQELAQELARRRARAQKFGRGLSAEDQAVFDAALLNLGTGLLLSAPPAPPSEEGEHQQEQQDGGGDAAADLLASTSAATGDSAPAVADAPPSAPPTPPDRADAESSDTAVKPGDAPPEVQFAVRKEALHVRGPGYLPLGTRDLMKYFAPHKPSCVEWLNGVAVNVIFRTAADAGRALACLTCRIPTPPAAVQHEGGVEGSAAPPPSTAVAVPHAAWRVSAKPVRKGKTDKWGMRGDAVTVYVRYATDSDVPGKCKGTAGARTYGTWGRQAMQRITLTSSAVGFQQAAAGQRGALPVGADIRIQVGGGSGRVGGGKRRRVSVGAAGLPAHAEATGSSSSSSGAVSALHSALGRALGAAHPGEKQPPPKSRRRGGSSAHEDAAAPHAGKAATEDAPAAAPSSRGRRGGGAEAIAAAAAAKQAMAAAAAAAAGPPVPNGPVGSDASGKVPQGRRTRTIVRKADAGEGGRLSIKVGGKGAARVVIAPPPQQAKRVITVTKRA